jgi:pimeloyl-ACP methyl ester carboxylesterase/DNA-binding CsgD family transcriptional regulator
MYGKSVFYESMSFQKSEQLSELIGLVYEAAMDISLWPKLMAAMSDWAMAHAPSLEQTQESEDVSGLKWFQPWLTQGTSVLPQAHGQQQELLAILGPHFLRAHDLQRQLEQADVERDSLERITDQIPMALAVLTPDGHVTSINTAMLDILRVGNFLSYAYGRLESRPIDKLGQALKEVATRGVDCSLTLGEAAQSEVFWLSRLTLPTLYASARIALMCAPVHRTPLPEAGLAELFGLTPAEARLSSLLTQGKSLEDITHALGISINTAKTLLKRIFGKLGVSRQTEMLQVFYASPIWLSRLPSSAKNERSHESSHATADSTEASLEHYLRLPDGRLLSYFDNGNTQGIPVIFMHGIVGARRLCHPDDTAQFDAGIRLIVPERPGCGHSSPQNERRIADWPADVAALADHLGIKEFVVMGYSAGTPYALATAWRLPERVRRVVLVAVVPEIAFLTDLAHYETVSRMALTVARLTPSLIGAVVRVMVRGIRADVHQYIENAMAQSTESDRRVMKDVVFRRMYTQSLLTAARQGDEHLAQEILLSAKAWGIPFDAIKTDVTIWHGTGDRFAFVEGACKLASQLPNADLRLVADAGHYLLYSHWREILQSIQEGLEADS